MKIMRTSCFLPIIRVLALALLAQTLLADPANDAAKAAWAAAKELKHDEAASLFLRAAKLEPDPDKKAVRICDACDQLVKAGEVEKALSQLMFVEKAATVSDWQRGLAAEQAAALCEKAGMAESAPEHLLGAFRAFSASAAKAKKEADKAKAEAKAAEIRKKMEPHQERIQALLAEEKAEERKTREDAKRRNAALTQKAKELAAAAHAKESASVAPRPRAGQKPQPASFGTGRIPSRPFWRKREETEIPEDIRKLAPGELRSAIEAGLKDGGDLDRVVLLCWQLQSSAAGNASLQAWARLKESETLRRLGCLDEALAAAKEAFESKTQGLAGVKGVFEAYRAQLRIEEAFRFYEACNENPSSAGLGNGNRKAMWEDYGFMAFYNFDPARIQRAYDEIAKLGATPGGYLAYRGGPALKMYKDFAAFPRDESDIVFPKDLPEIDLSKTVHAKDFGFDPADATAALQQAIDSDAGVVVVDAMDTPWRIRTINVKSNKKVVFANGVKVCSVTTCEGYDRMCLFKFKDCRNVVFTGEGNAMIGKYATREERDKLSPSEGGTGLYFSHSSNIVVRCLTIANNSCDGITFGDVRNPTQEVFIEDVTLDYNKRQGMSICNADGVYMRNVTIKDTRGAQPMCGIDLEGTYEVEANSNIYLFDCTFSDNWGGDINFSAVSYYPITMYAKKCHFKANQWGPGLNVLARCGVYMAANVKAPSRILFEGCDFTSHPSISPVRISTCSLFDVTLRRCTLKDSSGGSRQASAPPVTISLDREFWYSGAGRHYSHEGALRFEDVRASGYKGQPALAVVDSAGHCSVRNISGAIVLNGKRVDMSSFRYEAPDVALDDIRKLDLGALRPPSGMPPPKIGNPGFRFVWAGGPWYQTPPRYSAYFFGRQDKEASFVIEYSGKGDLSGKRLVATTPSGGSLDLGALRTGANTIRVAFPETGWYSLVPPGQDFQFRDFAGVTFAYQADVFAERRAKLSIADGGEYTGYFEVPAGTREFTVKALSGGLEIRDASGHRVAKAMPGEYKGSKHLVVKTSGLVTSQIWSFRCTGGGRNPAIFKFFAPLNGVWADDPAFVPRTGK